MYPTLFKKQKQPWLVWLSGLSASLQTEMLAVQFPVRAHAWVVSQVPSWVHVGGNCFSLTQQYFSHSLSPSLPLPLKVNKYNLLKKKQKQLMFTYFTY